MHLMPAPHHLLHQIQRLRRPTPARRIKRFVREKSDAAHGNESKNFSRIVVARSSCVTEIHSSEVCACAISPGPKTKHGIPAALNTAESQKKSTPSASVCPNCPMNSRTSGNFKSVSIGPH